VAKEVFAFVVDVNVHRPSDTSRRTVLGWTFHMVPEPHENMFHSVVRGLPGCDTPRGAWANDGYRAWVWFEGNPHNGPWRRMPRASNEHEKTAIQVLENGWHLD
jgi:hypothetical protein